MRTTPCADSDIAKFLSIGQEHLPGEGIQSPVVPSGNGGHVFCNRN